MRKTSVSVFFFESTIMKLTDHSYVRSSFATIRRHSDNGFRNDALQLKILRTLVRIGTNYFLSKFLETKIDESAWKILYTIICACSSKNIAPRYFTCCMLLFSQINLVFKSNIVLFQLFLPQFIYLFFTFDIPCLEVNPEPHCFL